MDLNEALSNLSNSCALDVMMGGSDQRCNLQICILLD